MIIKYNYLLLMTPLCCTVRTVRSVRTGGTWFQGIADSVANQRPTVQFSKMTGRTDSDPSGDSPEFENLDQILDLSVKDYKPGMPRVVPVIFSNPDSDPRFPDVTKGGELESRTLCTYVMYLHTYSTIRKTVFMYFNCYYLSQLFCSFSIILL